MRRSERGPATERTARARTNGATSRQIPCGISKPPRSTTRMRLSSWPR